MKQVEFGGRELLKSRIKINARFNAARNVRCLILLHPKECGKNRCNDTSESPSILKHSSSISSIEILIKKLFPR